MVKPYILRDGHRPIDAPVLAEGVRRDPPHGLQDEEVAEGVEDEGPRLLEAAGDLGDFPGGVDGRGEAACWDALAAGWEGGVLGEGWVG